MDERGNASPTFCSNEAVEAGSMLCALPPPAALRRCGGLGEACKTESYWQVVPILLFCLVFYEIAP